MQRNLQLASLALACFALSSRPEAAVVVGQTQTFSDPHGWVTGAGPVIGTSTPVPIKFGGPSGPADPYLNIISAGADGPGSKPTARNFHEWTGNYTAAGIDGMQMAVNNFAGSDLSLRLLFVDVSNGVPAGAAFTSTAVFLPSGSGWRDILFDLSPGALTPAFGSVESILASVDELRIFHNPDPFFSPGFMPSLVANLGVDNITAVGAPVPVPATWVLLSGGVLLLGFARRRGG